MRIPSRLRSRPDPKLQIEPETKPSLEVKLQVKPFQSVRFLRCLRCMGHGFFETTPPERMPTVVFSQIDALTHLIYLLDNGLMPPHQGAEVQNQILASGLPDKIPNDVQEVLNECHEREKEIAAFTSLNEGPVGFNALGSELAEAVHEFLLGAKGRPELKAQ